MKSNQLFKKYFVYPLYWSSHYTNIVSNMIQAISLYNEANLHKRAANY